jgi:hypothetical protein
LNGFIDEERLSQTRVWVDSIESLSDEVSGRSKEKVDEAVNFLDEHVYPGVPYADEKGEKCGVIRAGDKNSIGLIALSASDTSIHPIFKACVDAPRLQYAESIRSITVPPMKFSRRWMGITLFHELQHAKNDFHGIFRSQENAHELEEQAVYRDEHEVIRAIYGDGYIYTVDAAAADLSETLEINGSLSRKQLVLSANHCASLAMEEPKNVFEDSIRRAAIMMDLAFTALKRIGRGNPEEFARVTKAMESHHRTVAQVATT